MTQTSKKFALLTLGFTCLFLAILGVILPILPTTPFILLSAYCFSKSSERLHQWILKQKVFGPLIQQWESSGVIRIKAKLLATFMMTTLFSYTIIYVDIAIWIKSIVSIIGIIVLSFIWSRPSESPQ